MRVEDLNHLNSLWARSMEAIRKNRLLLLNLEVAYPMPVSNYAKPWWRLCHSFNQRQG